MGECITALEELTAHPAMGIFDTHTHYTSSAFNPVRKELLAALPGMGVALAVDCATDYASAKASLALSEETPWMYTAAGIHPQSLIEEDASTLAEFKGDWQAELAAIRPLYQHPKVVAVGEVGLDNHWPVPKEAQLALFEAQIKTALELDLPLVVHDREAHAETYALLKKYKPRGVLHSFSGSAEDVPWLCGQGMYLGFTGVATFKNAKRPLEAAVVVPEDFLLLETDCPYMAPEPYRGRKSHSGLIAFTAAKIAAVRGVPCEALLLKTQENGKRLFGPC